MNFRSPATIKALTPPRSWKRAQSTNERARISLKLEAMTLNVPAIRRQRVKLRNDSRPFNKITGIDLVRQHTSKFGQISLSIETNMLGDHQSRNRPFHAPISTALRAEIALCEIFFSLNQY